MRKKILLHALIATLLIFVLSACAVTNSSEGEPSLASDGDILSEPLLEMRRFVEDRLEPPTVEEEETEQVPFETITSGPYLDHQTFSRLYERVNPSVVNIQVSYDTVLPEQNDEQFPSLPQIPGFPQFDPENYSVVPMPRSSQGSGFIYDSQGHIITNNHVVENANEILVTFADGTEVTAKIVGTDPDSDLAVIKVETVTGSLQPILLGDSDSVKIGQLVVAIGNPFGLEGSMTTGIISGLGRLLPTAGQGFSIPDIIQTDAAINPGNSGGPLLNLEGEVIGVNTAIQSPSRVFAGIGYAIPAGTVEEIVPQLIENGQVEHPWLGIKGRTINLGLAEAMELEPDQRGVLVAEVIADSPAFEAGLKGSSTQITLDGQPELIGGDVITGIEDETIEEIDDLISYLVHRTEVGETVTLQILRDGERMTVEVTLQPRPEAE